MPSNYRKDAYFSLCFIEFELGKAFEVQQKLPSTSLPKITTQSQNDRVIRLDFKNREFVINTDEVLLKPISNEIIKSKSK